MLFLYFTLFSLFCSIATHAASPAVLYLATSRHQATKITSDAQLQALFEAIQGENSLELDGVISDKEVIEETLGICLRCESSNTQQPCSCNSNLQEEEEEEASQATAKTHSSKERLEPNINCPVCNQIFCIISNNEFSKEAYKRYSSHLKTHRIIECCPCPYSDCKKTFSYPSKLERHLVVHTRENAYECPICFMPLSQKEGIKRHIKIMHREPISE